MTDGGNTKSINPWDVNSRPEAWTWFTGAPRSIQEEYYAKVAAMYRAHNLKANAVASMPFVLLDKKGDEYDSSRHWENKVGFLPNPSELFRLNTLSYMATNSIYNLRTTDAVGYKQRGLYHAVPTTFTPVTNTQGTNVDYIARQVGSTIERYQYPVDERLVRMWRLDHTTELLPSKNTESQAIASAANIILYADFWIGNFFARGGIKPTLIAMKGLIDRDTKDDQEKSWSDWLKGVARGWRNARIYNSESIDAKPIGSGVDDMKDNRIYEQAIENIAMGVGMPLSLLKSNSSNYATAREEKATWYDNDITPFVNWLAFEYNTQVFMPLNLFLEFRPETLDPQQEDEAERATAFNSYMDALAKCPTYDIFIGMADTLGLELSETMLDAAKKWYAEKEKMAEPVEVKPTQEPKEEPVEDEVEEEPTKWIPSLDELEELRVWREVATRRFKKGESLVFDYQPHHSGLPDFVSLVIKSKLETCNDLDGIRSVFNASIWYPAEKVFIKAVDNTTSDILALAESINKLAESKII